MQSPKYRREEVILPLIIGILLSILSPLQVQAQTESIRPVYTGDGAPSVRHPSCNRGDQYIDTVKSLRYDCNQPNTWRTSINATTDSGLTSGRVTFAGAGFLTDDADLTFATDTLTATNVTGSLWDRGGAVFNVNNYSGGHLATIISNCIAD